MSNLTTIQLNPPYLVFIGDTDSRLYAKTALGLARWCPEKVGGQLRFQGNDLDIGLRDMTVQEAVEAGIKSIIIAVAPVGGSVGERWIDVLVEAAAAGLDVISGLHIRLENFPKLVTAANASGARLINVRVPPENLPIGNGKKRSGQRVLMVGTDCAVGKKYTALALTDCLQQRNVKASFRASGQTGIMIAGEGIPIDAVVADFVAGAAEILSPDNEADHWDVIEGQGSLFNPSYAGVSLSLLHGSQPDAIVVCHDAAREIVDSSPHISLPSVADCIALNMSCGKLTNPAIRCAGVSINTSGLPEARRRVYLQQLEDELGLPCVDPIIEGCDAIVDSMISEI